MTGDTLIIAGPSGGTSTFLGGLRQHVDEQDELGLVRSVVGNSHPHERAIEELFANHEYPPAGRDGYVVSYNLHGHSFARPEVTVAAVNSPGVSLWNTPLTPGDKTLFDRIESGAVPDPETVRGRYENDIRPDFERGHAPETPDDWKTVLLHHYYTADRVIFLLNLHTVFERVDLDLAYDVDDIEYATEEFESVAVVPTAVDMVDYDPDTDDGGLFAFVTGLTQSRFYDEALLERLDDHLTIGTAPRVTRLLRHVGANDAVDFFGVAVPDEGSPGEHTGHLRPDGDGGFEVQGFETVVRWLEH